MKGYLELVDEHLDSASVVAQELAEAIKSYSKTKHSLAFLVEFLFPFVVFHERIKKITPKPEGFASLFELRSFIEVQCFDNSPYIGFEVDFQKRGSIQVLSIQSTTSALLKAFGSRNASMSIYEKRVPSLGQDEDLRESLKQKCIRYGFLIDFLPLTMLEGLSAGEYKPFPKSRYIIHSFEMTRKEELIYGVAYAKAYEKTSVIGWPHGGFYYQILRVPHSHIVEINQCDVYQKPSTATGKVKNKRLMDLPIPRLISPYIKSYFQFRAFIPASKARKRVLVLPVVDKDFFDNYLLSEIEFKDILIDLFSESFFESVKLHPLQAEAECPVEINNFLENSFVKTDEVDSLNVIPVIFGDFSTMSLELAAKKRDYLVISFGDKVGVDAAYIKNFKACNKSFDRIKIMKPNLRKLNKYNNLSIFKCLLYFVFLYKLRAQKS